MTLGIAILMIILISLNIIVMGFVCFSIHQLLDQEDRRRKKVKQNESPFPMIDAMEYKPGDIEEWDERHLVYVSSGVGDESDRQDP